MLQRYKTRHFNKVPFLTIHVCGIPLGLGLGLGKQKGGKKIGEGLTENSKLKFKFHQKSGNLYA